MSYSFKRIAASARTAVPGGPVAAAARGPDVGPKAASCVPRKASTGRAEDGVCARQPPGKAITKPVCRSVRRRTKPPCGTETIRSSRRGIA